MKEKKNENKNETDIDASDTIFDTKVNLGLVLKVPLKKTDDIKQLLIKNDCRIIYQVISTDNLYVCKDKNNLNHKE